MDDMDETTPQPDHDATATQDSHCVDAEIRPISLNETRNATPKVTKKRRQWKREFIGHLRRTGHVSRSAKLTGVERKTCYQHYRNNPKFAAQWERALVTHRKNKLKRDGKLVYNAALKRATVGWEEPVFQGGERVGSKQRYSDSLAAKMLEALVPEFTPASKLELTGANGNAIQIESKELQISANIADLELVQQLLAGGMLSLPAPKD